MSDAGDASDGAPMEDGGAPQPDVSTDGAPPFSDAGADLRVDARDADARVDVNTPEDARRDMSIDVRDDGDAPVKPDACDPGTAKSPAESACLISEQYGVFVAPQGNDSTGLGTRAAPFQTLTRGVAAAKNATMRVYACDDGNGYRETLTVDTDSVQLFGGFECSGWAYSATRRAKLHPMTGVPLTIKNVLSGITIEDFDINAADGATGMSSIGAIIEASAGVVLRGVTVRAGKGGDGADGKAGDPGKAGTPPELAQDGLAGICGADAGTGFGGGIWTVASACGSLGGGGGPSSPGLGFGGTQGLPQTGVEQPDDNGGKAGPVGNDGKAGSPGKVGTAAPASPDTGAWSAAGFTPPIGGTGGDGNVGQGGGGGGASHAPSGGCVGSSGGAGGMGGCGGKGASSGGGAGASVALLIWTSTVTLDHADILAGAGGNGGKGGVGGLGGEGGLGGKGGPDTIGDASTGVGKGGNGGVGGAGGQGGPGAGGNGGPSYAIVYKAAMPPARANNPNVARGVGGVKGLGATVGGVKAPDGTAGAALDVLELPYP